MASSSNRASTGSVRRRPGAMDMELPTIGDHAESEGSTPSREQYFVFYMPAVLAQLGLVEVLLAFLYSHSWGMLMGSLALASGSGLLWKQPRRLGSGWPRALVLLFLVYVSLLVFVRLTSFQGWQDVVPDPANPAGSFPPRCPAGKVLGCTRVAESESHPDASARPPRFPVYIQDAINTVEKWAAQEPRTKVLVKRQEPMDSILTAGRSKCSVFMHIRALTLFMGFADDMFVSLECFKERPATGQRGAASYVLVSVQSQLRLGKGDMGVNGQRIKRFYTFLEGDLSQLEKADRTKRLATMAT